RADLARLKRDLDTGRSGSVATEANASSVATTAAAASAAATSSVTPAASGSGLATSAVGSRRYVIAGFAALVVVLFAVACIYLARNKSDGGKISSIAVLPFVNATSDPSNEYLSDGLTESLIGTLSHLPDMKVMARSTVFRFKGKEDDPQKIGQ